MTIVPNDLGGHPVIAMDKTYHETLKWINRIRRKHGKGGLKKIRKGRKSGYSCPIANSLTDCFQGEIYAGTYALSGGLNFRTLEEYPEYVVRFVLAFDKGEKYQELWA